MKGEISIIAALLLAADHQRTGGWAKPDSVKKAFDAAILIFKEAQSRDAQLDQMKEEFRAADEAKYKAAMERRNSDPTQTRGDGSDR